MLKLDKSRPHAQFGAFGKCAVVKQDNLFFLPGGDLITNPDPSVYAIPFEDLFAFKEALDVIMKIPAPPAPEPEPAGPMTTRDIITIVPPMEIPEEESPVMESEDVDEDAPRPLKTPITIKPKVKKPGSKGKGKK